jgi:hypothetical protein
MVSNANSDNLTHRDRTRSGPIADSSPGGGGGGVSNLPWSSIYNTPTTLAGYGITDAVEASDLADVAFSGEAEDVAFTSGAGLTSLDVAAALDELKALIDASVPTTLDEYTTIAGDTYTTIAGDDYVLEVPDLGGGGGSGDVEGPASATDNALARYDGTTGKLLQDSAISVSDAGLVRFSAYGAGVLTTDGSGNVTAAGSSGSGDMLSVLTASEISVTAATTATIGRMHVCSGTTANYTLTLPAVSGNVGKFLGVRMSPALTKLVTIDGNSSELIDGEQTRVMWADETAILFCDGTAWTKVAGKTLPFRCSMYPAADKSIPSGSVTLIEAGVVSYDPSGLMADSANNRIVIPRSNSYQVSGFVGYSGSGVVARCDTRIHLNGSTGSSVAELQGSLNPQVTSPLISYPVSFAAADTVQLYAFQASGSTITAWGTITGSKYAVIEIPSW